MKFSLWHAKLVKNVDIDKCKYFGYGIAFNTHGSFSLSNCSGFGTNVIIFGAVHQLFHLDCRERMLDQL